MDQLMDSDLVRGIFELKEEAEVDSMEPVRKLVCMACTLENSKVTGFKIPCTSFKRVPGINQPRWFINIKSSLLRHLKEYTHIIRAVKHLQERQIKISKVEEVHNALQHLLYFCLNSSLSFEEYPKLLAAVNRCKVHIGNINHSTWFIKQYCDMVGAELFERTVHWLKQQKSITVTLDIGSLVHVQV